MKLIGGIYRTPYEKAALKERQWSPSRPPQNDDGKKLQTKTKSVGLWRKRKKRFL